jgi:hypothetical protein
MLSPVLRVFSKERAVFMPPISLKNVVLFIFFVSSGCSFGKTEFSEHMNGRLQNSLLSDFILRSSKHQGNAKYSQFHRNKASLYVKETTLEETSKTKAQEIVHDKIQAVLSLYQDHDTPYAGFVTRKTTCPPQYLPKQTEKKKEEQMIVALEIYANSREVFGSCSKDDISFRAFYAAIVCSDRSVIYEVTLFVKPTDNTITLQSLTDSFQCPPS